MKKYIIAFILGGIFFSSITAIAISVGADEIQYDSTHTVKDKIDDLYNIATNYKNLSTTTTATASDLLSGKTAYDNSGNLITGSLTMNTPSISTNYFGSNYYPGRLTTMSASNTLNAGKYVCSAAFGIASTNTTASYLFEGTGSGLTISGCDNIIAKKNYNTGIGSNTPVTSSYYLTLQMRHVSFECDINQDNTTVTSSISMSANTNTPVQMFLDCTLID